MVFGLVGWLDAADDSTFAESAVNTITVCQSGCDYQSLQPAVDAADPGAIVAIAAGTCRSNVTVDKPLLINGVGAMSTTLDGAAAGSVMVIRANTVGTGVIRLAAIKHLQSDGFSYRTSRFALPGVELCHKW